MNLEKLLNKGYFPKELPPCFLSEGFGDKFNAISDEIDTTKDGILSRILNNINSDNSLDNNQKSDKRIEEKTIFNNKLKFSNSTCFSIPKLGISRNIIKIPNPYHQGLLSKKICDNYVSIEQIFSNSKISYSSPDIEMEEGENKRSIRHKSYGEFKEDFLLESYKYKYQLKTDISKFYSSIYTHSIPWATFGKEAYKRNRNLAKNHPSRNNNIFGDEIDDRITWCQNQQTKGIPIGPDTSLIIAEIISCHLDKLLQDKLKTRKIDWLGYRYYDDLILFFNSELDLQIALKDLRFNLKEFELSINDEKTKILSNSNELEKDWVVQIKSFLFREREEDQKHDLWNFFSIIFKLKESFPNDSVIKFALNKFNFVRIEKNNWNIFESLLFRLALSETASLQKVAKILVTYESLLNKNKLKDFCYELIERHYENNHDYELVWSLWLLHQFKIQIKKEVFQKIFRSNSTLAIVLGLYLLKENNRIKNFNYDEIKEQIVTENLNSENWILVYESIYHDLINGMSSNIIDNHLFFKILKSKSITFFNVNKTLEPLKVKKTKMSYVEMKVKQVEKELKRNSSSNKSLRKDIVKLIESFEKDKINSFSNRNELQDFLKVTNSKSDEVLAKIEKLKKEKNENNFLMMKRIEELKELIISEVELQDDENNYLLFNPGYDS